jgi:hypothetical protein
MREERGSPPLLDRKRGTRLSSAEATWQMAENLYRQLADQVREHDYDIKDLSR